MSTSFTKYPGEPGERFRINQHLTIFQRKGKTVSNWHVEIRRQPGWKKEIRIGLFTEDKEIAIKRALEIFKKEIEKDKIKKETKGMIFNEEERILATKSAALGRMAEDKFKNLMMFKGYQVYKPVEDKWGIDFVVFDEKYNTHKVQVKSSNRDAPPWPLKNTVGERYVDTCTHMAFVSVYENRLWYVPTKVIENHPSGSITHAAMVKLCKDYEVFL